MPLVFFCILRRHHDSLAEEKNVKSFGTLYIGRSVRQKLHKVHFWPLAFFYRRTIIVLVTVFLFEHPSLQLIVCHITTLMTAIYLVTDRQRFETQAQRAVEIGSEIFFYVSCIILQ